MTVAPVRRPMIRNPRPPTRPPNMMVRAARPVRPKVISAQRAPFNPFAPAAAIEDIKTEDNFTRVKAEGNPSLTSAPSFDQH